jgi:hypothetical protein
MDHLLINGVKQHIQISYRLSSTEPMDSTPRTVAQQTQMASCRISTSICNQRSCSQELLYASPFLKPILWHASLAVDTLWYWRPVSAVLKAMGKRVSYCLRQEAYGTKGSLSHFKTLSGLINPFVL